jgi:hypothetical protein
MRTRVLFMTGIMGIAVISGIIKSLSSPRGGAKKEEEEKIAEKEECAGEKDVIRQLLTAREAQ